MSRPGDSTWGTNTGQDCSQGGSSPGFKRLSSGSSDWSWGVKALFACPETQGGKSRAYSEDLVWHNNASSQGFKKRERREKNPQIEHWPMKQWSLVLSTLPGDLVKLCSTSSMSVGAFIITHEHQMKQREKEGCKDEWQREAQIPLNDSLSPWKLITFQQWWCLKLTSCSQEGSNSCHICKDFTSCFNAVLFWYHFKL